ncbi:DUF2075 domain-containing protein [Enterococcus casseliflavus]|uniref:DUF2075 domain-containing protein n=1 Tax=Enterococcus casseliflavus TaxID=37734 RepID=UPI002DB63B61|nr:DUF2075 domain-containing protein [Enterococcus casseliflavus]MEB8398902.1 DUF2075 domain-containing protein [Enterococcus casseliflavus]
MTNQLIIEDHHFKKGELSSITTAYIDQYPVVYILYNRNEKKRPVAYIGQTVQVNKRLKQHLNNSKRREIKEVLLIGHEKFNQSATYNIETNLINHFIGDEQFQLQNVSQTRQVQMHKYYEKEYYDEVVFQELWEELQRRQLAKHSIDTIRNKDVYKLSPFKELTPEQLDIKLEIIEYCKQAIQQDETQKVLMIEGEAGTGKSVLLASLYNTLQDYTKSEPVLKGTDNYLLVNHSEMLKTYHTMAESLPNLKKNHMLKPTSFINKTDNQKLHPDIVIVDEAHLLLTKKDSYNSFHYENQLEEIIKRAKITICIFDPKQVLKIKSYWDQDKLYQFQKRYNASRFQLKDQLRMRSSPQIIQWIDDIVEKRVTPIPESTASFELQIMETHDALKNKIFSLDKKEGLSRIISTFDYVHKKDGASYLVDPGGINLPWNTTDTKRTWAERPDTISEVGSIYTVQGFDLNNVGVVIGPSVDYDPETDQLVIDIDKYEDKGAFTGRDDMNQELTKKAKETIILNSLNVLMKRAIKGLYIYAINPNLRQKLLTLQNERSQSYHAKPTLFNGTDQ